MPCAPGRKGPAVRRPEPVRPPSLLFAPWERKRLATGGEAPSSGIGRVLFAVDTGVISFLGFRWLPWPRHQGHAVAVAILGANPVLNGLAAYSAATAGASVVLCPVRAMDFWDYALLGHRAFRRVVEGLLGTRFGEGPHPFLPALRDPLTAWIDGLFAHLGRGIAMAGADKVTRMPGSFSYVLGERTSAREAMVYVHPGEGNGVPVDGRQVACERAFSSGISRVLPALDLWPHRDTITCLFAERIVLTSSLPGFTGSVPVEGHDGEVRLAYGHSHLVALGTAARRPATHEHALERAVGDVVRAARIMEADP